MKVATGKVVSGKVVVEGERLREGATVTVLALDDEEEFKLGPDDEEALLAAIEEADRGSVIDGSVLLNELSPKA